MNYDIDKYIKAMVEKNASDLHIGVGAPVHLRVDEVLTTIDDNILTDDECKKIIYSMLSNEQKEKFERELELDMSFGIKGLGRFRVNVFKQRGSIAASIRLIPHEIWSFEQCGLPADTVLDFCNKPKGLILVTGATGSGKSTSLASMVNWINANRACHIMTIEDPIEFIYTNDKAVINQREVYSDTYSFGAALKHVLRQDPDVILIGEMRDLETIESALIVAETGHLVFATLHTSDCVQTINRIIDVFPAHQQQQIRTQLSFVLLGVLSQQLIPKASGKGRVLATEVMVVTPAVKSLIRESKGHQIYSVMQTSQKEGMKTMNLSLYELYQKKSITYEEMFERTTDPDDLKRIFKR
ncbi:MAG: type IV pilus twitching motility protein PilT [Candidatus Omnitrophota bacterium]